MSKITEAMNHLKMNKSESCSDKTVDTLDNIFKKSNYKKNNTFYQPPFFGYENKGQFSSE